MDSRPLIPIGLKFLSLVSLNPLSTGLINRIFGIVSAVVTIIVLWDVTLILAITYSGIDSILEVLIFLVYTQITIKMLVLLINKKDILTLLSNTNIFWKPTPSDFDQHEENKKIFTFVKFCVRIYCGLLMCNCVVYTIRPIFFADELGLPWKSLCSDYTTHTVCFWIEVYETLILLFINLGVDVMYISLLTNLICEFKLIKKHLPNLKVNEKVRGTDKEVMDELKKLIDHHNLVLETIRIMKYVYRAPLLGLFVCNMFAMCFSMIVLTSDADHSTKLQFAMVTIYYLIQLVFYCATGSLLTDESTSVSFEAYKAQWSVKTQPELRNALSMIIMRSNKPEIIIAGGIIEVLKSCFSFFTFMQLMYEDSEEDIK